MISTAKVLACGMNQTGLGIGNSTAGAGWLLSSWLVHVYSLSVCVNLVDSFYANDHGVGLPILDLVWVCV